MTLVDQIELYRLEEDLDDLVVDTALAYADAILDNKENLSREKEDAYYRSAWDEAANLHHKSVYDRIEWLKQHGWNEDSIFNYLSNNNDGEREVS